MDAAIANAPARRFQFSLAELLVCVLAIGGLTTFYWNSLSEIDDRRAVHSTILWLIGSFVAVVLFLIVLCRGRKRTFALILTLYVFFCAGLTYRTQLIQQQIASNELQALGACRVIDDGEDKFSMLELNRRPLRAANTERYAETLSKLFARKSDPPLIPKAIADAEDCFADTKPYRGYLFRMLNEKVPNPGPGMYNSRLHQGYVVVAYPAVYGVTGRKVYLGSNWGPIYERDFGSPEKTRAWIDTMPEFDPGKDENLLFREDPPRVGPMSNGR